jgi:hypothetical protein
MNHSVFRLLLLATLTCPALARHGPIESTLKFTEAIACVRVTSVTEDLRQGIVYQRANLTPIGNSYGMSDHSSIEVEFGIPAKPGTRSFSSDSPYFQIGQRSIVLLKRDGDRWLVLRQISLSDEGKVEEPEIFRALGFNYGSKASFAVDCLIAALKKIPKSESKNLNH